MGGGRRSVLALRWLWGVDLVKVLGGEAGGVMGRRGEKGVGGMER